MADLSTELLQMIAEDPRAFLIRNRKAEERIGIKNERIAHIWSVGVSITQAPKQAAAYTGPGDKVGSCALEIASLEEEIEEELRELRKIQSETMRAIRLLVRDTTQQAILEGYYLAGMRWEEIAYKMNYAYRWVLRLHKRGLLTMKNEAICLCEMRASAAQQR